jgi:hypothetical protein
MTDNDKIASIHATVGRIDERTTRSERQLDELTTTVNGTCKDLVELRTDYRATKRRVSALHEAVEAVEGDSQLDRAKIMGGWTAIKVLGAVIGGMFAAAAAAVGIMQALR